MASLTFSPIQDKVITHLSIVGYTNVSRLTAAVFEVPYDQAPTRSQREMVRQALRSLEKNEFVKLTRYIRNRERCWELTGKAKPAPPEKKRKPLTVVAKS